MGPYGYSSSFSQTGGAIHAHNAIIGRFDGGWTQSGGDDTFDVVSLSNSGTLNLSGGSITTQYAGFDDGD